MKRLYRFSTGEQISADKSDLLALLHETRGYLKNYEELFEDLDDESYIARGNGFCEAKYSEDFVEGQMVKYQQKIAEIEIWLKNLG